MMKEFFLQKVKSTKPSTKTTGNFGVKVIKIMTNDSGRRGAKYTLYTDEVCPTCKRPLEKQEITVEFFKPHHMTIFEAEMLYSVFALGKLPMDYAQYHKCIAGQEFIANIKGIQ